MSDDICFGVIGLNAQESGQQGRMTIAIDIAGAKRLNSNTVQKLRN